MHFFENFIWEILSILLLKLKRNRKLGFKVRDLFPRTRPKIKKNLDPN